jgi:hypothetical protein
MTPPQILRHADNERRALVIMKRTAAHHVRAVLAERDAFRLDQADERHLHLQPLKLTVADPGHV